MMGFYSRHPAVALCLGVFLTMSCVSTQNIDEQCFAEGTSFQLEILRQVYTAPHGLDLQYDLSAEPASIQISGEDWPQVWHMAGFELLDRNDRVYRINACKMRSVMQVLPGGGSTITPHFKDGYLSLFDILLIGPREEIVQRIHEIEIERNGKRMILRPTEAIYRQIPK